MNSQALFHASATVAESAMALAYRLGINAIELGQLANAVYTLSLYPSTFVTKNHADNLQRLQELGYLEIRETGLMLQIDRTCPPGLLLNYFWSVWVPDYFASRHQQITEQANACGGPQEHFLTVVYWLFGDSQAAQRLLHALADARSGARKPSPRHLG